MPPVVVKVTRPVKLPGARLPGVITKVNVAGVLLTVAGLPAATASQLAPWVTTAVTGSEVGLNNAPFTTTLVVTLIGPAVPGATVVTGSGFGFAESEIVPGSTGTRFRVTVATAGGSPSEPVTVIVAVPP